MANSRQRAELATRVEQRRQELGARADVSTRLRELSASGSRFPAPTSRSPKRSTLLTLIIAASAVAGLLLIAVIATAVIASGVWVQTQLDSPTTVAEDYFSAVHQQDYPTAYSKFSTGAQASLTEPKFERNMKATDLIAGGVESYSVSSANINGATAIVTVEVVRRGNTTTAQVFEVKLVLQQQSWRIDTIRQTGQAPAPTPSN